MSALGARPGRSRDGRASFLHSSSSRRRAQLTRLTAVRPPSRGGGRRSRKLLARQPAFSARRFPGCRVPGARGEAPARIGCCRVEGSRWPLTICALSRVEAAGWALRKESERESQPRRGGWNHGQKTEKQERGQVPRALDVAWVGGKRE